MPGSARDRLRNIMMATQHGTRSPDHLQIELLQLVAELLIEIKQEIRSPQPAPSVPAPANGNGHQPHQPQQQQPQPSSMHSAAFGL